MEVPKDFSELLESFNAYSVEYLIVGGYALAHHGAPRFTGDLGLFVRPTSENAKRVLAALDDFGFAGLDLTIEDFCSPDKVVQLGQPPIRIDLLTGIDGVTWDEAARDAETGRIEELDVMVINRAAFIANRRASGRSTDLADLEALGES
jgi:hypothetical protein